MALSFNGSTTSLVRHTTATGFDVDTVSIIVWFQVADFTNIRGTLFAADYDDVVCWFRLEEESGTYEKTFGLTYKRLTTNGRWMVAVNNLLTTGVWYCAALTYDRSSVVNDPAFYLWDTSSEIALTSRSVFEKATPVGSATSPGAGYDIGSSGINVTTSLDGREAHVQVLNRILTLVELNEAARNPGRVTNGLILHCPMWKAGEELAQAQNGTVTNATLVDGPPVGRYVPAPVTVADARWVYPRNQWFNVAKQELLETVVGNVKAKLLMTNHTMGAANIEWSAAREELFTRWTSGGTFKAALLMTDTTCSRQAYLTNLAAFDDLDEFDGSGYTPGYGSASRKTVTVTTEKDANADAHAAILTIENDYVEWSTLSNGARQIAGVLFFWKPSGASDDSDNIPIYFHRFAESKHPYGLDFRVNVAPSPSGLLKLWEADGRDEDDIAELASAETLDICDDTNYADASVTVVTGTDEDAGAGILTVSGDSIVWPLFAGDASRDVEGIFFYIEKGADAADIPLSFHPLSSSFTLTSDTVFEVTTPAGGIYTVRQEVNP